MGTDINPVFLSTMTADGESYPLQWPALVLETPPSLTAITLVPTAGGVCGISGKTKHHG